MSTVTKSTGPAAVPLRFATPIGGVAGTSFKPEHLPAILEGGPRRGFFEVHAENYMGAGGPPHRALEAIRRDHPLSLHGVCMSIGGPRPLDKAHLAQFPEGYRHLAYLQSKIGYTIKDELPGLDGAPLAALYAKGEAWLKGKKL